MRVRATAMASAESNAIGSVELECTPVGLAIGLFGLGASQDGYAPGALTHGTRICVPYAAIAGAECAGELLLLQLDYPAFPHDRLSLSRFCAGPGVPLAELQRRRLILHFSALSLGVSAVFAGAVLAPARPSEFIAWGALGYGVLAALLVLGLGYSLDQRLFVRPPDEQATRQAFVGALGRYLPGLTQTERLVAPRRPTEQPALAGWRPRLAAAVGVAIASAVLTGLVSGQRLLTREEARRDVLLDRRNAEAEFSTPPAAATREADHTAPFAEAGTSDRVLPARQTSASAEPRGAPAGGEVVAVEGRCLCDRADSALWPRPIPRLSALLLERRQAPRKTFIKSQLDVAVVNNSDTPIKALTIHIQFYEKTDGTPRRHTQERPLYFEGPLAPGQAIKWTTEARGTEFEIQAPDFGTLGPNGEGAAAAETFVELLKANHRPVRMHAARMLSYLGDPRGRVGALELKDALRASEGPYLRRILAATADLKLCDVQVRADRSIGACIFNAGDAEQNDVGVAVSALDGALDTEHPLAHPPTAHATQKWRLPGALGAQAGQSIRVHLPVDFAPASAPGGKSSTVEVTADHFELLD